MKKKLYGIVMALVLMGSIVNALPANAAKTDKTYINATYGYLTGTTNGYTAPGEKCFYSTAQTTKSVSRIRSKLSVCYYSNGKTIGDGENTGWLYNSKYAGTYDYEMHHFKNAVTNKYDGFLKTKCSAYGTADAITEKSYVVYTKCTY